MGSRAPADHLLKPHEVPQACAVLAAAYDEPLCALYVLALCLGLRRGELLGLRWSDIDLEAGTLEVVHALQRVGGELCFVPPKTEDSERTVPLPDICIEALKAHRQRRKADRANAWPNWQEHDLVFPARLGTPLEPDNLRRSWGRISVLGSPAYGSTTSGNTCVSLLLDLGVPPHIVREIVGRW